MEDHWTHDDELLARFVRGTLTASERQGLDEHLQGCDRCRDAVEAERVLAAGIRRAGRTALRARLRGRLEARRPLVIPWVRVAGAAAVLVIVAGIVVLSRWQDVVLTPGDDQPMIADLQQEEGKQIDRQDRKLPEEPVPPVADGLSSGPGKDEAKEGTPESLRKSPDIGASRSGALNRRAADQEQATAAPAGREELRITATEIKTDALTETFRDKSARSQPAAAEQSAFFDSASTPLVVHRVPGLPYGSPPAQSAAEIPCLAEVRGDSLVVTVFRAPPQGAGTGEVLQAELLGTDSLILRFPDFSLGLKLPRGFPGGVRLVKAL
jgi:hypothetical protein